MKSCISCKTNTLQKTIDNFKYKKTMITGIPVERCINCGEVFFDLHILNLLKLYIDENKTSGFINFNLLDLDKIKNNNIKYECCSCGNRGYIKSVTEIKLCDVLIKNIPAKICNRCGDMDISIQLLNQISSIIKNYKLSDNTIDFYNLLELNPYLEIK